MTTTASDTAPQKILYTAKATVEGGRDGRGRSDDGNLDVALAKPQAMGGAGGSGTNPEQLFAVGYAACFLGALKAVAGKEQLRVPPETTIQSEVGFGPRDSGGFGLAVALHVTMPGIEPAKARQLVDAAHQICPYSNATRGNIPVTLTVG